MLRTAILGIVAVNAWNSIPVEMQWVTVLSILLLISNFLIKISKPILYTIKGGYSIVKWIGSKITIPIGKITRTIKLEKEKENDLCYIIKYLSQKNTENEKIIKHLKKELKDDDIEIDGYLTEIANLKKANEQVHKGYQPYIKTLTEHQETIKELQELYRREVAQSTNKIEEHKKIVRSLEQEIQKLQAENKKLASTINGFKENSNFEIIQEIGQSLHTPFGGNISGRAKYIYEEYEKLKEENEKLKECNANQAKMILQEEQRNKEYDKYIPARNSIFSSKRPILDDFTDKINTIYKDLIKEFPEKNKNPTPPSSNEPKKILKFKLFNEEFECEGNTLEIILDETGSMHHYKETINKALIDAAYSMPTEGMLRISAPNQQKNIWITINKEKKCFELNGKNIDILQKELQKELDQIQYEGIIDPFYNGYDSGIKNTIIITDGNIAIFSNSIKNIKETFDKKNTKIICLDKREIENIEKFGLPVHYPNV